LTLSAVAVALVVGPLSLTPAAAQAPGEVAPGDTVVGEVVRAWAEPRTELAGIGELHAEPLTWVEPENGDAVRVPTDEAEDLPLGATVEVAVGDEVVDEAATEGGLEPARELLSAEVVAAAEEPPTLPATPPFTNEVTVALVIPAGGVQDATTPADVVAAVDGPTADFWEQESNGAIRLGVTDQNDWYQALSDCRDPAALWDEVADHVGFVDGPGQHLLLYLPAQESDCAYGLAEVGLSPGFGGRLYVRDTAPSVIAHEFGHNFSLGHSGALVCEDAIEPSETGTCGVDEYGDLYDVMGYSWGQMGSLSAPHADQLGFLPAGQRFTFTAGGRGGVVTLSPTSGRTGMRAVRLVDSLGYEYWVESRTATGRDAWLGNASTNPYLLDDGVLVRSSELMPDASLLLDPSPPSTITMDYDLDVAPGRAISLAGGEFTVSVSTVSGRPVLRVTTASGEPFPRDWSGDPRADVITVDRTGTLLMYPGNGTGGFWQRRGIGRGWQTRDLMTQVGDWDGDGRRDMVARDTRTGALWLYRGNAAGGFVSWGIIGRGWGVMDTLISPGDWDGDGNPDLIARWKAQYAQGNSLYLYRGNGRGGFLGAATPVGTGWGVMKYIAASGDWDGNGTQDIVAVDRWTGVAYHYPGNGTGGFAGGRVVIGRGWLAFDRIIGPGDWNGDGINDLIVGQGNGNLWLYPGNGKRGLQTPRKIGTGWTGFRLAG
jgi:hypothetical protein